MFEATCLTCGAQGVYSLGLAGHTVRCKSCADGWLTLPPGDGPRYITVATAGLLTAPAARANPAPIAQPAPAAFSTVQFRTAPTESEGQQPEPPQSLETPRPADGSRHVEGITNASLERTESSKLKTWGLALIYLGGGTLLLSQFGLEFRGMGVLGDARDLVGFAMLIAGVVMGGLSYTLKEE